MALNSKVPDGPIAEKWDKHRFALKLVNPANKRKFNIIVVGTGLAGGSAAASLAELANDPDKLQAMSRFAQSYATKHFDKSLMIDRYSAIFDTVQKSGYSSLV